MEIVADSMLSKLARWLRLANISVIEAPYKDDDMLIGFVRRKNAVLLTSDYGLYRRSAKRNFKALLVTGSDTEKQLAFVSKSLGLRLSDRPGRICPVCNHSLVEVRRDKLSGKVPEMSFKRYRKFFLCKNCGRVYWRGTHWKRIGAIISRAKRLSGTVYSS